MPLIRISSRVRNTPIYIVEVCKRTDQVYLFVYLYDTISYVCNKTQNVQESQLRSIVHRLLDEDKVFHWYNVL